MKKKMKDSIPQASTQIQKECAAYFLSEVEKWMDDVSDVQGKIHCPNSRCNARLGSFAWSGSQCSCGTWVTPSIKVIKSRVDAIAEQL
uniref:Uncharacterized protein AlNc14C28G2667 n=1 Tax=Albugo laibachii Nc14 TaxID=890382 RepID=F0W738_9STRA|nr:conserved hypothetical protein [Albugo laibachii Nc14]|eukprot:CCA16937.1 conserved hypothetical protein [Albugo laibachii Nc14]